MFLLLLTIFLLFHPLNSRIYWCPNKSSQLFPCWTPIWMCKAASWLVYSRTKKNCSWHLNLFCSFLIAIVLKAICVSSIFFFFGLLSLIPRRIKTNASRLDNMVATKNYLTSAIILEPPPIEQIVAIKDMNDLLVTVRLKHTALVLVKF